MVTPPFWFTTCESKDESQPAADVGTESLERTRLIVSTFPAEHVLLIVIEPVYVPPATQMVSPHATEEKLILLKSCQALVQLVPLFEPVAALRTYQSDAKLLAAVIIVTRKIKMVFRIDSFGGSTFRPHIAHSSIDLGKGSF